MISNRDSRIASRAGARPTVALAFGLILLAAGASAAPEWWPGTPKEALEAAKQSKKALVLYFETEKSADCIRMNEETFPKVTASGQRFTWIRLRPDANQTFFEYYDIYQTPQMVILNSDTEEKGRIQGFVDADLLMSSLDEAFPAVAAAPAAPGAPAATPAEDVTFFLGGDGVRRTLKEYKEMVAHRKENEKAGYFIYEGFDKVASLDDLIPLGYSPLLRNTMRLDPAMGSYNSPALFIGAELKTYASGGIDPAVCMRVELSRGLEKVQAVEGRLRVQLMLRTLQLPNGSNEVGRIVIQKADAPAPSLKATQEKAPERSEHFYLKESDTRWTRREVKTGSFNFRSEKAYLLLWVNRLEQSYVADDLIVEILPPDDSQGPGIAGFIIPDPIRLAQPSRKRSSDLVFMALDKDGDGIVYRKDVQPEMLPLFDAKDKNKDGIIRDGVRE